MANTNNGNEAQYESDGSSIDYPFSEREMLYAARESHLESLNRLFEEIGRAGRLEALTVDELQIRRDVMQWHFDEMKAAHTKYRQCCLVSSDGIYRTARAQVRQTLAQLEERLNEFTRDEHSSTDEEPTREQSTPVSTSRRLTFGPYGTPALANSTLNADNQQVIRVETARRPQIGTFTGETEDWPPFRDLFIAEVHNRDIDPVTKLHYLREACKGKAAETLGPWQPTAGNYQLAWETMVAAYNDEYHIIHGILAKLHATRKQDEENHAALRSVLDTLNSSTRQLHAITSDSVLLNQIWIHHAKQRLPSKTLDAWEQYRNQTMPLTLPTLDDFKMFLDSKAKAKREFEHESTLVPHAKPTGIKHDSKERRSQGNTSGVRYKPYDTTKPENKRASGDSFGYGPPPLCVMTGCGQTHYLGQCQQFERLSYADKLDVVREHRLCRCCLTAGHMALNCKRNSCNKCPEDKMKHHFRLCKKLLQPKQNPFTAPKATTA